MRTPQNYVKNADTTEAYFNKSHLLRRVRFNNSDNNDEEVIIDSTSDNTSSIVSKKSLLNKIKNQLNLVRREYKEKFYNQETPLNPISTVIF